MRRLAPVRACALLALLGLGLAGCATTAPRESVSKGLSRHIERTLATTTVGETSTWRSADGRTKAAVLVVAAESPQPGLDCRRYVVKTRTAGAADSGVKQGLACRSPEGRWRPYRAPVVARAF